MINTVHFWRHKCKRTSLAKVVVVTAVVLLNWAVVDSVGAVGKGAVALLTPDVAEKLKLTGAQKQQVQTIARATARKFGDAQTAGRGQPGLKEELEKIRQAGQDEALALLTAEQKAAWVQAVIRHRVALLVVIGRAPYPQLAANFIACLPQIVSFVSNQQRPFIAKIYRPAPAESMKRKVTHGTIALWYPR